MTSVAAQLDAMYRSDVLSFDSITPTLAGAYAYSLGYLDNGKLRTLRNDSGDLLPLMADRPPRNLKGSSPNHSGRGQNVLAATYLIQLQGDKYVAVWPEQSATAKLSLPYKGW